MKNLNIGCGRVKKEGFIGVDILKLPGVDVIHDLNKFPYPFKENEIDEIFMDQCLEHLDNPINALKELYRISKNGAKITIGVPYFRSFYSVIDPTHKNFFTAHYFDYFDPNSFFYDKYSYFKDTKFKVENIEFDREVVKGPKTGIIYKTINYIANKNPKYYEKKLSHLYPLNSITFYLKVIK
jgi:SAM-dependent methyltransferase